MSSPISRADREESREAARSEATIKGTSIIGTIIKNEEGERGASTPVRVAPSRPTETAPPPPSRLHLAPSPGYINDDHFANYLQVPSSHWFYTHTWLPSTPHIACCFIVPGAGAHGGHYEMPAKVLQESGFAVFAIDPLSCGRSDGEPGNPGCSVEVLLTHLEFWFEATLAAHPVVRKEVVLNTFLI
ncbi:hypothetical protein TrLO_g11120 [Triparma laevis f. longispina]|uniref:Uncharacterized protein n=1 Tax=Triparma laevis f. longispina TaxID=1714387 RepID=A0A9W7C3R1_9STRA|nr:hypothetical protein TrLO_g11120 [Triparma laevis f. longispina]